MSEKKQKANRNRHDFLLTYFFNDTKEEFLHLKGFVLKKYYSNNTKQWEVAIYTEKSWAEYLIYGEQHLQNNTPKQKQPCGYCGKPIQKKSHVINYGVTKYIVCGECKKAHSQFKKAAQVFQAKRKNTSKDAKV